jgi:PAS domain S-box-containing protein
MADKKNSREVPDLVKRRQKVEARLAERRKHTGPLPSMEADVQHLVHELEVHQIELEMQNEELKQARAEREAALDQYTDLYDFAPTGYFTLARDGAILGTNLTGAKLLGVERSKLLKKRFGLFVADEFRVAFIDFIERIFDCGGKESQDVLLGKRVGEPKWVLIEAICTDDKQECRAMVTDITERKQADDKLLKAKKRIDKSEARFKAIAANTPDHILMHDKELRYSMVINPQLGLTEEEILGKTDHDFLAKEEADKLVEAKKKVMESGEPMYFETSLISRVGKAEIFAGTYIIMTPKN